MLFWRVYDHQGNEHILNLDHVTDIMFPEPQRRAADGEEVEERPGVVTVSLSNGESLWLERNPNRRQLVDDLILNASRVEREAIKETKRSPKKKMQDQARAFWAEFPAGLADYGVGKRKQPTIHVRLVKPGWVEEFERKVRRNYWRARRIKRWLKRG